MYFPAGLEATAPFSHGEIRGGGPQAASGDSSSGNWSVRDGRSRVDREADRNRMKSRARAVRFSQFSGRSSDRCRVAGENFAADYSPEGLTLADKRNRSVAKRGSGLITHRVGGQERERSSPPLSGNNFNS